MQKIAKTRTALRREPVAEVKSITVSPYIQGVSKPFRRCLEQQGIHTVFKSDMTLRSHLMRPRTPSIRLNKVAWSTGFPASAAKSTLEKQRDLCRRGSKSSAGIHSFFFFIRTSNFGAEAERSYFFLRFEPENVLNMLYSISINPCERDQETYESTLFAVM